MKQLTLLALLFLTPAIAQDINCVQPTCATASLGGLTYYPPLTAASTKAWVDFPGGRVLKESYVGSSESTWYSLYIWKKDVAGIEYLELVIAAGDAAAKGLFDALKKTQPAPVVRKCACSNP